MDGRNEDELNSKNGKRHPFFQRSDSTTFVGCLSPDPFQTPLTQALPLAERPQLLRPNSRREELFGIPKQNLPSTSQNSAAGPTDMHTPFDRLPTHLALSVRTADTPYAHVMPTTGMPIMSQLGTHLAGQNQTAVEVEAPCMRAANAADRQTDTQPETEAESAQVGCRRQI